MVRAAIRIATHDAETVAAIHAALDARRPIALLHAKLPADVLARQRAAVEQATFSADDAIVLFTSGSTGTPRGVVLGRDALEAAAHASWAHLGRHDDDRWLCVLPLAHAGGLSIVIRCRFAGVPCVLARDPAALTRERATLVSLVPAQLAQLLANPAWRPPASLRAVLLGGAAAPPALVEQALARGVPVRATYGLTETFGQVATARVPGGWPVALAGISLRAGVREAPATIRIAGPMLATRYLDGTPIAPELVTADLGYLEGGELHVIGRTDDVVISGGENVHPAQVEAVLAATPGVRAAAAFGVPDERWGAVVAAALVVDTTFERARAIAHWRAALPPFARPRRLATLVDLPRLPSGKIDRKRVAEVATRSIDDPAPHDR